jgi:hypothetical protein
LLLSSVITFTLIFIITVIAITIIIIINIIIIIMLSLHVMAIRVSQVSMCLFNQKNNVNVGS